MAAQYATLQIIASMEDKKMTQRSVTEEIERLQRESREWLDQITVTIKAVIDEAAKDVAAGKYVKWPLSKR